jgi:hypothetical protein
MANPKQRVPENVPPPLDLSRDWDDIRGMGMGSSPAVLLSPFEPAWAVLKGLPEDLYYVCRQPGIPRVREDDFDILALHVVSYTLDESRGETFRKRWQAVFSRVIYGEGRPFDGKLEVGDYAAHLTPQAALDYYAEKVQELEWDHEHRIEEIDEEIERLQRERVSLELRLGEIACRPKPTLEDFDNADGRGDTGGGQGRPQRDPDDAG